MSHPLRLGRIDSVVDAVGDTPLVRLRKVAAHVPDVEIFAKLEFCNPGGSVKDRAAWNMIKEGIRDGKLTRDKVRDLALRLLPNFHCGRLIMGFPIIGIVVLVRHEIALRRFAQTGLRLNDRPIGTF